MPKPRALVTVVTAVSLLFVAAAAEAGVTISTTGCGTATASTTIGTLLPGESGITPQQCVVEFGSDSDTSMLKLFQADSGGDAMLAAPVSGVVAWWAMNDSPADASGGGRSITLMAPPSTPAYTDGPPGYGRAMSFDGDDGATVPHDAAFDLDSFTVEAWFRTTTLPGPASYAVLVDKKGGGSTGVNFELYFDGPNGRLGGGFTANGNVWEGLGTSSAPYADGQWHHVALVVGGGTKALYVDGQAMRSEPFAGDVDNPAVPIGIGRFSSGGGSFTGEIDEVRIHSVPRSAASIRSYYAGRIANYSASGASSWSGGASLFGACLEAVGGAGVGGSWLVDGNAACSTTDADPWMPVAATAARYGAKVAESTTSGQQSATVSMRFAARAGAAQVPGTYAAPVVFEVVAPNLPPPANTSAPTISGIPNVGQVLGAEHGTWTGDGLTFSYQWRRCDAAGANCVDIAGAIARTYTLLQADAGATMRVVVTGENGEGRASATSAQTAVVTAPSLIYVSGFEHGTRSTAGGGLFASQSSSASTDLTFDSTIRRTGTYSLRAAANASWPYVTLPTGTREAVAMRFALRLEALPASRTTALEVGIPGGTAWARLNVTADGQLRADFWTTGSGTVAQANGPTAALGQWYLIDMLVDPRNAAEWRLDWRVDGAPQPLVTYNGGTAPMVDVIKVGWAQSTTATVHFDDLAVSATATDFPLGDGEVVGLAPDGMGAHVNATRFRNDGGSNIDALSWQRIDDVPMSSTADYIYQSSSGSTSYVESTIADASRTRVANAVRGVVGYRSSSTTANVAATRAVYAGGGAAGDIHAGSMAVTSIAYGGGMLTRPANGWTPAEVDGLRVRSGFWDGTGGQPWWDSVMLEADFTTGAQPPLSDAAPSVSGTTTAGSVLTASPGTWSGASPITYAYQWQRCDGAGENCVDIGGETGSTYTIAGGDAGSTIRVRMTASNPAGTTTAVSAVTATITASPPTNDALPVVSGTFKDGNLLSGTDGTWSGTGPITYSYQWYRCDRTGAACSAIGSATAATYTAAAADVWSTLRLEVTATNAAGSASATSGATPPIAGSVPLLTFVTGFEHGTISTSGGGLGSALAGAGLETISTTTVRHGSRSLRLAPGATGGAYVRYPTEAASSRVTARFAVNLQAYPTGGSTNLGAARPSGGTGWAGRLSVTTAGQLLLDSMPPGGGAGAGVVTGPTLALGQWYTIDVTTDTSTGTWRSTMRVNGLAYPESAATGGTFAPSTLSHWQLGTSAVNPATWFVDDFVMSNLPGDFPIGHGKVVGLLPTGTGAHVTPANFGFSTNNGSSFTALTAGDSNQTPGSAQHIDDWPVVTGASADLLRQTVRDTNDYLAFQIADTAETVAPQAVRVLGAHREESINGNSVIVGGMLGAAQSEAYTGYPAGGPTTVEYHAGTLNTRPGGGAWTAADLNALQLYLDSQDIAPNPWTDALMVEAAFPVTAAVNSVPPSVSGTLMDMSTLTTSPGTWSGSPTYSYQWQRCDSTGANCTDIVGATSTTYTLTTADVGETVRVVVTATNALGSTAEPSAVTARIEGKIPQSTNSVRFKPATNVMVGDDLYVDAPGDWIGTTPITVSFQWARCSTMSSSSCVDIPGATGSTYTITLMDVGYVMMYTSVATNSCWSGCGTSTRTSHLSTWVSDQVAGKRYWLVTGFEHGTASDSGWSLMSTLTGVPGGTVAATSSPRRNGNYALKIAPDGANAAQVRMGTPHATPTGAQRFAVRFDSLPSTTIEFWQWRRTGGSNDRARLQLTSGGVLRAGFHNGTMVAGPSVTLGQWYLIELSPDISSDTWLLDWRVNGAAQTQASRTGMPTDMKLEDVRIGMSGTTAITMYFDDWVISPRSSDYPIGDGKVIGLVPNAVGTHNNEHRFSWSTDGAGTLTPLSGDSSSWNLLDDWPVNSGASSDVVAQTTSSGSSYLEYHFQNPGETAEPDAVRVVWSERVQTLASSSSAYTYMDFLDGGAQTWETRVLVSTAGSYYTTSTLSRAPSGASWTNALLNGFHVRWGFASVIERTPQLEGVMLEVSYPIP